METTAPKACSERVRVLVLAQQENDVGGLPEHIVQWGYEVACVQNVSAALDCIQKHHIQIVLAPWDEGVGVASDFCAQVRQLHDQRYSYIILIVNDSHGATLVRALEAGADDVLSSPLDNNELEARLQSAVRRLALQQQLNIQTEVLGRAHALLAQDLKTVSTLQRSYLPPVHSQLNGVRYQWLSLPSLYVSGDHLNVFQLHDDCVAFYVLDVSGHGVSAAVKSMQVVQMLTDRSDTSVLFEAQGLEEERVVARPHRVVSRLNALFQQTESDLSYFTMIYGLINTRERTLTFCQAGHPSPLLLTPAQGVNVLGNGGYPVGLFEDVVFLDVEHRLGPKEVLLLYSDGLTEVLSDQEEPFGDARLFAEASAFAQEGGVSEGLIARVARVVQGWGGRTLQTHGFQDDVSMLALALSDGPAWVQGLDALDGLGADEAGFRPWMDDEVRQAMPSGLGGRRRVLIVDDSRSFLRIFQAMLSNWGFEVYTAQDGQEALALIERVLPDFVLSDWDMPSMSGIELCHRVRSQQQNAYIYLIMVTGYASREDLLQSLRMGADDFLTKPVNPSELKVRLGTAARIAQLHISLRQRHEQLLRLYDGLQHDMKEVARIQRTLLPVSRMEPWPCASQALYHPAEHVCGMLWGELDTPPHLYGFFMVSMRTHDLSAALQVMAFSRWLSSPKALSVLCHSEGLGEKQQWFLADPEQACQKAIEASSAFIDTSVPVDLLYGLLHVRQGVLLLAGRGRWSVLQALPEQTGCPVDIPDHQEAWRHQHVLAPGERFFVCPAACFNALGLGVLSEALESKRMQGLLQPFVSMTAAQGAHGVGGRHLMCLGLQWRESFSYRKWVPDAYQQRAWLLKWKTLAAQQDDSLRKKVLPMETGDLCALVGYSLVCDTVNVAAVGMGVRLFLEQHHVDEVQGYNVDLALSECLTNVMVHAFAGQRPKPVTLAVWVYTGCVCVMVADLGARIPEAEFQRVAKTVGFDQDLAVDVLPEGGMGLLFMREVSKRLVYESAGGVNTLWMMF